MEVLLPLAARIAGRLRERGDKIAIAESSTGGLISAALLAQPGASAYFLGGAVVYTMQARAALLDITPADMSAIRPASEPYAALVASRVRIRHNATWGLGESGATGPTGSRYGDPAGHTCIAIDGPVTRTLTLQTGDADRERNMRAFAVKALETLAEALG
jgi:nicotinamide-nucleotide amidase